MKTILVLCVIFVTLQVSHQVEFRPPLINYLRDVEQEYKSDQSINKPRTILDIIRELIEKIQNIIYILTHIPTNIEELQEAINEVISHVNIHGVIRQLKREVNDLLDGGGSNTKTCRAYATKRIHSLEKSSEDTTNQCLREAEVGVQEIRNSIDVLENEARTILQDIVSTIRQCFEDNIINQVGFYKCVESHVRDFENRISELQEKVGVAIETGMEKASNIVSTLATCMNTVRLNTIKEGQVILKDVETCLLTIGYLYRRHNMAGEQLILDNQTSM